jgi:hypothetical protein
MRMAQCVLTNNVAGATDGLECRGHFGLLFGRLDGKVVDARIRGHDGEGGAEKLAGQLFGG